jgi:hypothetical protein
LAGERSKAASLPRHAHDTGAAKECNFLHLAPGDRAVFKLFSGGGLAHKKLTFAWIEVVHYMCVAFISKSHTEVGMSVSDLQLVKNTVSTLSAARG